MRSRYTQALRARKSKGVKTDFIWTALYCMGHNPGRLAPGPALLALPVPRDPDADLIEKVERDRHRDLGDHLRGRQHRAEDEREDRNVAPVPGEVRMGEDPDLHQE